MLHELKKLTCHPTSDEFFLRIKKKLPNISLASVYRNLDLLSDKGLIKRLETGGKQKRYDGNTMRHHHIRCLSCGKVEDFMKDIRSAEGVLENLLQSDDNLKDFHIEFTSFCKDCSIKNQYFKKGEEK